MRNTFRAVRDLLLGVEWDAATTSFLAFDDRSRGTWNDDVGG